MDGKLSDGQQLVIANSVIKVLVSRYLGPGEGIEITGAEYGAVKDLFLFISDKPQREDTEPILRVRVFDRREAMIEAMLANADRDREYGPTSDAKGR
jgi:hypothetical protein